MFERQCSGLGSGLGEACLRTAFPTRQVVPSPPPAPRRGRLAGFFAGLLGAAPAADVATPTLQRFRKGLDAAPTPMTDAEIADLGDVFSQKVLLAGRKPMTLRALADAIAAITAPALALRKMFLVAEGAQAVMAGHDFDLNARLVFTWQASDQTPVDVMLSTVADPDSPTALLQLIAWSEKDAAFHFFERKGGWTWAGNSFHALVAPTRGEGPFDSHINGGLVMKERQAPWTHWHSQSASIDRSVFGAAAPFNTDPLFARLEGAEVLQSIMETGVRRWTKGRLARDLQNGVLTRLPEYLRQVLWCTSFNLVSSRDAVASPTDPEFTLPSSAFFDIEALEFLAGALDGMVDIIPSQQLSVAAPLYRDALAARGIVVLDESAPPKEVAGDTQFAFLAPERAFEDRVIVEELVNRGALSPRLGLCLLLVDFANPVFSPTRAALLRHAPAQIAVGNDGAALDQAFIAAATAAGGAAEAELLGLWNQPDLLGFATQALEAFRAAVQARLATPQGVAGIVDLADSRREVLRETRSLAEFKPTLPRGAATPSHLAMRPDGTVFVKTSQDGEGEL